MITMSASMMRASPIVANDDRQHRFCRASVFEQRVVQDDAEHGRRASTAPMIATMFGKGPAVWIPGKYAM